MTYYNYEYESLPLSKSDLKLSTNLLPENSSHALEKIPTHLDKSELEPPEIILVATPSTPKPHNNIMTSINSQFDMENVLTRFGINTNTLAQVPLEEYHWWKFDTDELYCDISTQHSIESNIITIKHSAMQDLSPESPISHKSQNPNSSHNSPDETVILTTETISQRIRTLRRSTISKYKSHKPCA